MSKTPRRQTLYDAYRFPGFTPGREVKGVFGDRNAGHPAEPTLKNSMWDLWYGSEWLVRSPLPKDQGPLLWRP